MNHLALNTDYALRTGAFDPSKGHTEEVISDSDALKDKALQRYVQAKVQHYVNVSLTCVPDGRGALTRPTPNFSLKYLNLITQTNRHNK